VSNAKEPQMRVGIGFPRGDGWSKDKKK